MTLIPTWVTPPGSLGTIPEGVFYSLPLQATSDSTVYYRLISGNLPPGMQINETGILSGNPQAVSTVQGIPLDVSKDTTSQFVIRAYTGPTLADRTFSITVSGLNTVNWVTASGTIGTYFDGTQITNLAVSFSDPDPYSNPVVTLIAGALPTGLTVSSSGIISGYITPNPNASVTKTTYSFTLKVSNGVSSDTRSFNILVYARSLMTGDDTYVTGDNTFITADITPLQPPIITTPTGSIGSTRSDYFYAFQFTGLDFAGNPLHFIATSELPPGLTLDPNTGWLYGYIPYAGILSTNYSFTIQAVEVANSANHSKNYTYSLTITGPVNSDIVWVTPSDPVALASDPSSLGSISNGDTSTFYVEAVNVGGTVLQYKLLSGSDSRLPQGLELLPSGNIVGRVSFDAFALDGGLTTFDVTFAAKPTTFDMVAIFTVNAFSSNGLINLNKTFSITVVRTYQKPYDNLYIQAMPPQADRDLVNSLLQNPTIFPPALIYRYDDPNFGISTRVVYEHAYGLTAATYTDYVNSLNLNHYWKNLVLGEIKTAQALDDNGNVLYEVVYSEVVDNLVNNDGTSVSKEVVLPFPINRNTANEIDDVYPNSLVDMRTQVIDSVGQVSNVLPRWMLSRQPDGSVLGFTPAWVIAYTNPGQSGQIAYNIETYFGNQLNLVDFKVDRYEVDNLLTKNWNRNTTSYTITNIVGNGTQVTVSYNALPTAPFAVGQQVTIAGVVPQGYNGTYFVTSCTTTQLTFVSELTTAYVSGGTATTLPGWDPTPPTSTIFDYSPLYAESTWVNDTFDVVRWTNNNNDIVGWQNTWNGEPTTFDGNSLQFISPVDMYAGNTTEYDAYLLFPKSNIIQPVPQVNQIEFTNNENAQIIWTNSSDVPLIFTGNNA